MGMLDRILLKSSEDVEMYQEGDQYALYIMGHRVYSMNKDFKKYVEMGYEEVVAQRKKEREQEEILQQEE